MFVQCHYISAVLHVISVNVEAAFKSGHIMICDLSVAFFIVYDMIKLLLHRTVQSKVTCCSYSCKLSQDNPGLEVREKKCHYGTLSVSPSPSGPISFSIFLSSPFFSPFSYLLCVPSCHWVPCLGSLGVLWAAPQWFWMKSGQQMVFLVHCENNCGFEPMKEVQVGHTVPLPALW